MKRENRHLITLCKRGVKPVQVNDEHAVFSDRNIGL